MNMLWRAMNIENLSWLEKWALAALKDREVIYSYQLPHRIGPKTMEKLVRKGFLQIVNSSCGRFSQNYGWRKR